MGYGYYGGWAPYVPMAERRRRALAKVAQMKKKGRIISPIEIAGRTIANTFWGKAWCDNLETYSDYENRLPRGRTYVRNGSVVDLQIVAGKATALVSGSSLYKTEITIRPLEPSKWKDIVRECSGKIGSLIELLQGRLSGGVMEVITRPKTGLFPTPKQISFECSCPDWASMCKHVAATLYGVGARLDQQPELLFLLRKADQKELISRAGAGRGMKKTPQLAKSKILDDSKLSKLFGIELDEASSPIKPKAGKRQSSGQSSRQRGHVALNGKSKHGDTRKLVVTAS